MNEQHKNQQTEEYKELRAEIRHYLSRRQNTRNFAYLITLAVLGSSYFTSSKLPPPPPIFILRPLLTLCLWADEIGRLRAIQRLATYIRVFIEPNDIGLQYETLALYPSRRIAPVSRLVANLDYPLLFFALAGLCCWKFFKFWPLFSGIIILISLLILSIILFREAYIVARHGEEHEESRWHNAKNEIQKKNCEPGASH